MCIHIYNVRRTLYVLVPTSPLTLYVTICICTQFFVGVRRTLYTGMRECTRVCVGVCGYTWVTWVHMCVRGCTWIYVSVRGCILVYTVVAWVRGNICVRGCTTYDTVHCTCVFEGHSSLPSSLSSSLARIPYPTLHGTLYARTVTGRSLETSSHAVGG